MNQEDINDGIVWAVGKLLEINPTIEQLLEALSYGSARWVSSAITALVEIGEPAVEPLIKILRGDFHKSPKTVGLYDLAFQGEKFEPSRAIPSDENSKCNAAEALRRIGGAEAVDGLVKTLGQSRTIVMGKYFLDEGQYGGSLNNSVDVLWCISKALGKMGDSRAVKPLIKMIEGDNPNAVCVYAAKALGEIGDKRAVKPLIGALDISKDSDGAAAVEALGMIGDPLAVGVLIKALGDNNRRVRQSAAEALGKIGDTRAVEPLIKALKDEEFWVRGSVVAALGSIGDTRAVAPLIKMLENGDSNAAEALGKIGDSRAVKPLIESLGNKNLKYQSHRHCVLTALGQIGGSRAVVLLIEAIGSDGSDHRIVTKALVGIGMPSVGPLINVLKDGNKYARAVAAEALGRMGDEQAVEPFIKALGDEYWSVRKQAAIALGKFGDERAVEALIKTLWDDDWGVCGDVAEALGKIGDKRAVGPLIKAVKDDDWQVRSRIYGGGGNRQIAVDALGKIGDVQAVELLIKVLEDDLVSSAAACALGKIGDERAIEPLKKAGAEGRDRATQAGIHTSWVMRDVDALINVLNNGKLEEEKFYERMTATKALGDIGDTRAVEPLIKTLRDNRESSLRGYAAEALGKIRDERALEPLIEALIWNEDGRIGREYVAVALGQFGDKRAIQPLIEAKEGIGSIPFVETCEDIIRKLQRG